VEQFVIATAAVGQEGIALAGRQLRCLVKQFFELSPALAVHEVKPVRPPDHSGGSQPTVLYLDPV
jgi:hypothetical protein